MPVNRMNNNEIRAMVDRFLGWKLPEDFAPDCGIAYTKSGPEYAPVGTNLFTATQAEAMVRHMLNQ